MIPTEVAEIAIALAKALGGDVDDHISLAYKLFRAFGEQGWEMVRVP